jgi:hypothetical protein
MYSKIEEDLTEWEKIFASYTPRIYRKLKKLNVPKNQWPNKKKMDN